MNDKDTRVGLRLLEFETGVASNLDDTNSAELVDYQASRTAGQAARLAMLIRGQDVIEDERRLMKVAAVELGMTPPEYGAVKSLLQDADLIEERVTRTGKRVLNEKVERLNHADNYRRIGELWLQNDTRTEKEQALISTLDRVIETPSPPSKLDELSGLEKSDRNAVVEVGTNAGVLELLQPSGLFYSPLLWDVSPDKLSRFVKVAGEGSFRDVLKHVSQKAGTDLTCMDDPVIVQAVSSGVLPSYRVTSTGGLRIYSFAPYLGGLLNSDVEKTIMDKARSLVACLRYGNEAATVTKIRNPAWILSALMDPQRKYRVGPHSELKQQYGMLVGKQLGKVIVNDRGWFYFELIPTSDNLRACQIASELLSAGEVMGQKDPITAAAITLVSGKVEHPLREVKIARKKRAPRADELADLVERLRSVT